MVGKNEWIPKWELKKRWGKKDDEILDLVLNHGLKAYSDGRILFIDRVTILVNEPVFHQCVGRMQTSAVRKTFLKDKKTMLKEISYFRLDDILDFEIERDIIPQGFPDSDLPPAEEDHKEIKTNSALSQKETKGDNYFRFEGSVWHIGFEGKEKASIPDSQAIRYIVLLLENTGHPIPCLELQLSARGIPPGTDCLTDKRAMDEGLNNITWPKSSERVNDSRAEMEYKKRYQELRDRLDQGDYANDTEREKIENEMEDIEKTFHEKNFNNPRKKTQSTVGQQIKKAYRKIEKAGMENLSTHLQKNISTGGQYDYIYRSEKTSWDITW